MANNLTYAQRRLRALIAAQEGGSARLSYNDICAMLQITEKTAITAVKYLERAGILQVKRSNGRYPNEYRLR